MNAMGDKVEFFNRAWPLTKFHVWIQRIRDFLDVNGITDSKKKLANLRLIGGEEATKLLMGQPAPSQDTINSSLIEKLREDEFEIAILTLEAYVKGSSNELLELKKLHELHQSQGERTADFVGRIRDQVRRCGTSAKEEDAEILKVLGMKSSDDNLVRKIIKKTIKTLPEALEEAELNESLVQRKVALQNTPSSSSNPFDEINFVRGRDNAASRGTFQERRCFCCGKTGHMKIECPKRYEKCRSCQFTGHLEVMCKRRAQKPFQQPQRLSGKRSRDEDHYARSKRTRTIDSINLLDDDEDDSECVTEAINLMGGGLSVSCKIGGAMVEMALDTGTKSNIIDQKGFELLRLKKAEVHDVDKAPRKRFFAYGAKSPIIPIMKFCARLVVGDKTSMETFYVVPIQAGNLLGSITSEKLALIKVDENVSRVKVYS